MILIQCKTGSITRPTSNMVSKDIECSNCGNVHNSVKDEDGYWLAMCENGTTIMAYPGDEV